MTILFTLVNVLLIAFLAWWEWRNIAIRDSLIFWSSLSLRLAAGISVGLLYMYYYGGGDTWTLFNDATSVTTITEPRSQFFVSIVRVINFITLKNYWLTSLWLSLFSFVCSYRLVAKLDSVFPSFRIASRVALLFTPSIVFWSSGILKESVALGAVAMLSVYFLSFMNNEKLNWKSAIGIVLFLYLLLSLKYYWAAVLVPSMITAVVIKRLSPKKFFVGSFLLLFLLICLAVSFTHPNFYLSRFLTVIVDNHDTLLTISSPENTIRYYDLTPTWSSMIINSPWALWSGLFRPMVFEARSLTAAIASVENLLLLVLVLWKLLSIRKPPAENRVIVLTALVYVTVLCIFLALSTPNLGTLSRYRVGFLPFFVLLILANHPILKFINGESRNHIRS